MKSVASVRERIAAERNVSFEGGSPASFGGQGSRALSVPMREESPAARITPAKLGNRAMLRTITESRGKVSEPRHSDLVVFLFQDLGGRVLIGLLPRSLEPAQMGKGGARVTAHRNQFSSDRHSNLLRRNGADIESDGSVDAIKQMCRHALILQRFENLDDLALRADHPDVTRPRLHRPTQN